MLIVIKGTSGLAIQGYRVWHIGALLACLAEEVGGSISICKVSEWERDWKVCSETRVVQFSGLCTSGTYLALSHTLSKVLLFRFQCT